MTLTSYNKLKELGRQGILIRKRGREKILIRKEGGKKYIRKEPWEMGRREKRGRDMEGHFDEMGGID